MKNRTHDSNYLISTSVEDHLPTYSSTPVGLIDNIASLLPNAIAKPFYELKKLEIAGRRADAYNELCLAAHASIHATLHELAIRGQLTPELRLFYFQLLQCSPL